jgi:hypothetical protein
VADGNHRTPVEQGVELGGVPAGLPRIRTGQSLRAAGLPGAWHTNWVFVPGYANGNAPYRTWTAKRTMATPQWAASENITYDIGAAVVNRLNGEWLTDAVRGQGIAFNQSRGQHVRLRLTPPPARMTAAS